MNAITTTNQTAGADPDDVVRMIENNHKLQPTTKAQYRKAITNALAAGVNLADADSLASYAAGLNKSSRSFLKAAVRLWGADLALRTKAGATPENIQAIQATVYRIEALNEAIKIEAGQGQKAHSWLTQAEVRKLLDTCHLNMLQGKRDRVVLGLLVGAGLRREELVKLTFADIVTLPNGGKTRTALNVHGKGAKDRVVPINDRLAAALADWRKQVGDGHIARSMSKGGKVGEGISAIGVFQIVAKAGASIGKPELAPHDLRRTYVQLGYEAGVPITQISRLLGHASVATTQRYLNLDLDLSTTVSDFIPY